MADKAEALASILETINDEIRDKKWSWGTLIDVVRRSMGLAKDVVGMSGPERRDLVIAVADRLIDDYDIPWIPDPMVDPILKELVPSIIDHFYSLNPTEFKGASPAEDGAS